MSTINRRWRIRPEDICGNGSGHALVISGCVAAGQASKGERGQMSPPRLASPPAPSRRVHLDELQGENRP